MVFDSPFIADPAESHDDVSEHNFDFQATWNTLEQSNSRGWCELSVDNVVRRLQTLQLQLRVIAAEESPFQGESTSYLTDAVVFTDGICSQVI